MDKLRCLLINPVIRPKEPPYNLPLGLAHIAGVIDSEGHDVAIFDNNIYKLSYSEIINEIQNEKWDIIGIGNLVTTYTWQKKMFHLLKKKFPSATLIAGGGLATSLQEHLMNWIPEIDILVVGEGERTIVQILKNYGSKDWGSVDGIFYRSKKIIRTKAQKLLSEEELSKLPYPKYDLLPLDIYFNYSKIPLSPEAMICKRRLPIETSRGCPFQCSFCIDLSSGKPRTYSSSDEIDSESKGMKIRYYNIKWVIGLIKHLRLKYAVDFLSFVDENFACKRKKVIEFCEAFQKEGLTDLDPQLKWGASGHVNVLDEDILRILRNANCSYLDLGLESMNNDILKIDIIKGSTPQRNAKVFDECIKTGVYPITNFTMGYPNETVQSIYDITKFIKEKNIECGPFFVTPYPMTGLFERCKEKILNEFGSLEEFVKKCEDDVSLDFVVNLTKFNDAELLGLRQMVMNHDLDQIKKFANEKREKIVSE
ncbi:MAG: radical SAM protein [Euryarchaeota archaeon]|nr:radical SAM protein [Euryarchaeota archaeon]